MRTIHSIPVGRRFVVLRSDGQVYIGEPEKGSEDHPFLRNVQLVATSAGGCSAMAEALEEMANFIREKAPL
jgi:hypothetical protein